MQAVILAAGEGKRLRPLTRSRPKALIPIGNVPIIDYVIEALLACGIRDIIVVAGYRREQVISHLNSAGYPVRVVVQDRPLGTAHALVQAREHISERFLVLPGDNYIDSESIARVMDTKDAVLVKDHPYPSNFGVVEIRRGYVTRIVEKPEQAPGFTISTGIFSLGPDFFDFIGQPDLTDAVSAFLGSGRKLKAVRALDWQDAIYPWDLLPMNRLLIRRGRAEKAGEIAPGTVLQGHVRVGAGTRVHPGCTVIGPAVIGPGCEIGPNACIMPNTSLGSRVQVGPFSLVGDSIILDDAVIGPHSLVRDAVIGEGSRLEDHVSTVTAAPLLEIGDEQVKGRFGAIVGEKVRIGPFSTLRAAIVGNGVVVRGGREVTSTAAIGDGGLVI